MNLVPLAQPAKNADRVLDGRLADDHRRARRIAEGVHYASALASARQMRISAITPLIEALVQRRWLSRRAEPSEVSTIYAAGSAPAARIGRAFCRSM